ncbi:hypothetical protein CPB97_006414 [Podila verticillata]|nr:hypothetical protein CPB97_006414 [Podila verticillata]
MADLMQAPIYAGIALFVLALICFCGVKSSERWQLAKELKRLPQYNEDIELEGQSRARVQADQARALAHADVQAFQDAPAEATPPPAYMGSGDNTQNDAPDYPDQAPTYAPDYVLDIVPEITSQVHDDTQDSALVGNISAPNAPTNATQSRT